MVGKETVSDYGGGVSQGVENARVVQRDRKFSPGKKFGEKKKRVK